MELTELCQELNNWFELKKHFGAFTIENGSLKEDIGLLDGQYYRIIGSVFNDGVHQFGTESLSNDEAFDGAIWAMAVPLSVVALLDKMNEWETKYADAVLSPYSSESFGGYSYTKSSGMSAGESGNGAGGVFSAFADDLNRWRKV